MLDLRPYQLAMQPLPAAARAAIERDIEVRELPSPRSAASFLGSLLEEWRDGVYRAPDGRALVLCTTTMPQVEPRMIDWWFGWHLPESARYRLWHPEAHWAARCRFDRQHLILDRDRYIGNVSYVDEVIGKSLRHLAIAFLEPREFGFDALEGANQLAVCAVTSDRLLKSKGGCLVHHVLATPAGSEMRSAFWLGDLRNEIPMVGSLITAVINRRWVREQVLSDAFLKALLRHCAEEMNHLARFLPALFNEASKG